LDPGWLGAALGLGSQQTQGVPGAAETARGLAQGGKLHGRPEATRGPTGPEGFFLFVAPEEARTLAALSEPSPSPRTPFGWMPPSSYLIHLPGLSSSS